MPFCIYLYLHVCLYNHPRDNNTILTTTIILNTISNYYNTKIQIGHVTYLFNPFYGLKESKFYTRVCFRNDRVCSEGWSRNADPQHHSWRLHQPGWTTRGRRSYSGHQRRTDRKSDQRAGASHAAQTLSDRTRHGVRCSNKPWFRHSSLASVQLLR